MGGLAAGAHAPRFQRRGPSLGLPTASWGRHPQPASTPGVACAADRRPSPAQGGWGGPGYLLQNAVAVGLAALLALAAGDVALKLLVVAYSLVAAGFRYTVIALLLLVLISLFR